MPEVLSGVRVSGDETRAEEIVAVPITTVSIPRRRAEWHVDDAACDVHGEKAPHVDAGALLPALAGPRVVESFSGTRNRPERPHQRAGVNVPGPNITSRPAAWALLRLPAGDDEVAVHQRRRAETVAARIALQYFGRVQIDHALIAECRIGLAGLRVERIRVVRQESRTRPVPAFARHRASTRHHAWMAIRTATETPMTRLPSSDQRPRHGRTASRCTSGHSRRGA